MKLSQCNFFVFLSAVVLSLYPMLTAFVLGEDDKAPSGIMIMTPFKWMDSYDDGKVKTIFIAERAEISPGEIQAVTTSVEFFAPDGKSTGKIFLDNCRYESEKQKIVTDSNVKFVQEGLIMEGCGMHADIQRHQIDILKDVKVTLSDSSGVNIQGLFSGKTAESDRHGINTGRENDAFVITSRSLKMDGRKRMAEFLGNVTGTNSQNKIRSEYLNLKFSSTNELKFLRATGNVYLEGTNVTSQCESLDYNADEGKALMKGDVTIVYEDRTLKGSTVNVWTVERRLESLPGKMIISRKLNESNVEKQEQSIITARSISLNAELSMGFFNGDVILDDPEISMRADAVSVTLGETNQIKRIAAKGDVEMVQSGRSGRSQKAYYLGTEKIMVMIGDAYIKLIDDELHGDEIIYWINEDRVKCYNTRLIAQMGRDASMKRRAIRDADSRGTKIKIFE